MGGLLICFVGQRFHFFLHNFNQSDRFLWSQQHQQLDRRERGLSSGVSHQAFGLFCAEAANLDTACSVSWNSAEESGKAERVLAQLKYMLLKDD